MFADIVRFINLSNETPIIIFGGTTIKDEPICDNDINNKEFILGSLHLYPYKTNIKKRKEQ